MSASRATFARRDDEALTAAIDLAASRRLDMVELLDVAGGMADPAQAAALYQAWIACNADHPALHAVYFNYAVCLSDSGDRFGAANALRATIRLKPDFAPPHINLGGLLERMGQSGEAVQTWLSLAGSLSAITPEALGYKVLALKQAGRVLEACGSDTAAEEALRQSLELDPGQVDAMQHLVALRQRQCKWPLLPVGGRLAAGRVRAAISPLSAAYHADDPIFHLACSWHYARHCVGLPGKPAPRRLEAVPQAGGRLRVGYVSSDLRAHAVGFAMTEVMELHDPRQVEIFAYYCGIPGTDDTQARIRRAVHHWTDINAMTDAEAAQAIRQDGIDILVDLNGYTKDARTKVFALRPAPVVVNWFGFPGTMGSPYHHYIIADPHVIPSGQESWYSEKVLRLPCYQPNDRKRVVAAPPGRAEAGLPAEGFVFCCLNGMQKLTADMFAAWMEILRRTDRSVLWLLSGTEETNQRLRDAALAHGISPERLVFAGKMANPQHLARMVHGDLFLDTFPYGAHTTASDALWMGLPVLALQGRSFAARVCASLVRAAGLPEMVCLDRGDYVARAVALAHDQEALASIRARLAAGRETCALFDTPGLVRALEALYRDMHEAARRGAVPRPDLANLNIYHDIAASEDLEALSALPDDAWRGRYVERLAELDSVFPVRPDNRLWKRA